jgi:hypothetical protein
MPTTINFLQRSPHLDGPCSTLIMCAVLCSKYYSSDFSPVCVNVRWENITDHPGDLPSSIVYNGDYLIWRPPIIHWQSAVRMRPRLNNSMDADNGSDGLPMPLFEFIASAETISGFTAEGSTRFGTDQMPPIDGPYSCDPNALPRNLLSCRPRRVMQNDTSQLAARGPGKT